VSGCTAVRVEHVVGEKTVQIELQETFTLPETKPCPEKIVSINKSTRITEIEVMKDRVTISGKLDVHIVYMADKFMKPVHNTLVIMDFTETVDLPGAESRMTARVRAKVVNLEVKVDPKQSDTFEVCAALMISVRLTHIMELNLMTDPPAGVKARTVMLHFEEVLGVGQADAIVSDKAKVPCDQPEIDRVLDVAAEVSISDQKVMNGQVMAEGDLHLKFFYVACDGAQSVHTLCESCHFTKSISVSEARPGMHAQVEPVIRHIGWTVPDPESVNCDAIMELTARVTELRELTVVTDIEGMEAKKQRLRLDLLVGEESCAVTVKEEVEVPRKKPGIEKVLEVKVSQVEIPAEDIVILKGRVIVSGTVCVQILYACDEPEQSVHCLDAELKFRCIIPVTGAETDQNVRLLVSVEHAMADAMGDCRRVTPEVMLNLTAHVINPADIEVVLCQKLPVQPPGPCPEPSPKPCPEPGPAPHMPCPFQHVIVSGDTFWLLAMKYHVSVDSIMRANPGVDPMNLQIGSVIIIPCDP
jgi:hypothetical protein